MFICTSDCWSCWIDFSQVILNAIQVTIQVSTEVTLSTSLFLNPFSVCSFMLKSLFILTHTTTWVNLSLNAWSDFNLGCQRGLRVCLEFRAEKPNYPAVTLGAALQLQYILCHVRVLMRDFFGWCKIFLYVCIFFFTGFCVVYPAAIFFQNG